MPAHALPYPIGIMQGKPPETRNLGSGKRKLVSDNYPLLRCQEHQNFYRAYVGTHNTLVFWPYIYSYVYSYHYIIDLSIIINSLTHGSTTTISSNGIASFPAANPPLSSTLEEFHERFTYHNKTFRFEPFEPEYTRTASMKNIPNNIDYEALIEWFNLFCTPEILAIIMLKHTNEYGEYH